MMTDKNSLPRINYSYGSVNLILKKYDRYARKDCFSGQNYDELTEWQQRSRHTLTKLLGLEKMDLCSLNPIIDSISFIEGNIKCEHVIIQVEPDVWMTMYILIPENCNKETIPFICPNGHGGAGKYSVAGIKDYSLVNESIKKYNYDYGLQLAKAGYVAICPDCRGFGERRECLDDSKDSERGLNGDCYWLAHMGEAIGIPVAGMLTWDLIRLVDYIVERNEWNTEKIGCLGFSGGGMQTLWLSAIDERVKISVISGYFYGCKDSLLLLNRNCSCNYVPHLWEHFDMGDIASLIAPRPLWIQSCKDDRLNGPRGIQNVFEQTEIVKRAYSIFDSNMHFVHEICEGNHKWHGEHMKETLEYLKRL